MREGENFETHPRLIPSDGPEITTEQEGVARKWGVGGIRAGYFSQFSPANLWDTLGTVWGLPNSRARVFSYNKRTTDRAMGAFLAVVTVPRINNLRVLNTLDSSTPVASTSYLIYYQLLTMDLRRVPARRVQTHSKLLKSVVSNWRLFVSYNPDFGRQVFL